MPRELEALSTARHVAHVLLLLIATIGMGAGGFFHCVTGRDVNGPGGWTLVPKTRWGFHDQFIDLDKIDGWNISDHQSTIAALVEEQWLTLSAPTPAETDEPFARAAPARRRWCFHTASDDWCFDRLADCSADRKYRLAHPGGTRPTSKCFKED